MNVSKLFFIVITIGLLASCATGGSLAKKQISNLRSGYVYGALIKNGNTTTKQVCDAVQNHDQRWANFDNYKHFAVASQVKFTTGGVGAIFLVENNIDIGKPCITGSSNCTYLKIKVEPGKLGKVIEVVSRPGESICKWEGLPRVGGVVCPSYDWDYNKDNGAAISF